MTCPDDPSRLRRMLAPPDHLEPAIGVTESEVGKLKRTIAMLQDELATWRENFPEYQYCRANTTFPRRLLYNGVEMFDG